MAERGELARRRPIPEKSILTPANVRQECFGGHRNNSDLTLGRGQCRDVWRLVPPLGWA